AAVSLAATVCWEWCRRRGDKLSLVVAGPAGAVLTGVTGPEQAQRLLECLALLQPGPTLAGPALLARLGSAFLRGSAAVLLVSTGPSSLAGTLRQRVRRGIACLDASALAEVNFYQAP